VASGRGERVVDGAGDAIGVCRDVAVGEAEDAVAERD